MNYRLLPEHHSIREAFREAFVMSYPKFTASQGEWIATSGVEFNEEYYDKMFMWDKLLKNAHEISFADALALLKGQTEEVFFLTESPKCCTREFCQLNSRNEFVAAAAAKELAECISYEWFTEYELFEKGCHLADPILPSDLYVFDKTFSWCLIFTHETDETESADSRFCLYTREES